MIGWRFWVWFTLMCGWTVIFITKTRDLSTLEYFVGLLVITTVYVVSVVIVTRLPEFIPHRKIRRGFAIILASILYYFSFKFILNNLKIVIFNENNLMTGFIIGIAIGVLYMIADTVREANHKK